MPKKTKSETTVAKQITVKTPESKTRVKSILLGLLVAIITVAMISIEIIGRKKGLESPEEWHALIKKHEYEFKDSYARSSCPMLNTLANHGFLPRDGRDMKPAQIFDALMLLRVPPTFTFSFLAYVFYSYKEANPNDTFMSQFGFLQTIDLDRLKIYNIIEHDVSLTRQDHALPPYNTSYPIPHYVERLAQLSNLNNTGEFQGHFTVKNEHDARRLRWLESSRDNRNLRLSINHQFASSAECVLLLDIMGRNGQIRTDFLVSFLLHEKFPADWTPRETTISITDILTKSIKCWRGLHQSEVTLDLLHILASENQH